MKRFTILMAVAILGCEKPDPIAVAETGRSATIPFCKSTIAIERDPEIYKTLYRMALDRGALACAFIPGIDSEAVLFETEVSACNDNKVSSLTYKTHVGYQRHEQLATELAKCHYAGSQGISKRLGSPSKTYTWHWRSFDQEHNLAVQALLGSGLPIDNYAHVDNTMCFEVPAVADKTPKEMAEWVSGREFPVVEKLHQTKGCKAVLIRDYGLPYIGADRP